MMINTHKTMLRSNPCWQQQSLIVCASFHNYKSHHDFQKVAGKLAYGHVDQMYRKTTDNKDYYGYTY